MAVHGARVAFCTERAAEACRAEGVGLLEPAAEAGAYVLPDNAAGKADAELLHGATSYLSMLHDTARNAAYDAALRAAPASSRLVLDLGAGTGLLALLACRALPSARGVACEVYGGMARLAERVVAANGFSERVQVANKLASELEVGADLDLPERADVCVFELFDSQLLGESIMPILRDAHARLLTPSATLVPQSVRVRAVLVECPALSSADLPELRGAAWPLALAQLGLERDGELRDASATPGTVVRRLSAEWDALEIDFRRLPPQGPRATPTKVAVTSSGTAHAVAWWWDLDMGGGGHLSSWTPALGSGATVADRSHWKPCLSFLEPREVKAGDRASVAATHDDEAVWFAWHDPDSPGPPPRWVEGVTLIPPERERLLAAASAAWTAPLLRCSAAAGAEAARVGGELLLLPADDGLLLPRLSEACLDAGARVQAALPPRVARRLREAGQLREELRLCTERGLQTLGAHFSAVLVEPHGAVDVAPWSLALDVRKRLATARSLLAPGGKVFPSSARLLAQLVQAKGAWLARQPLADTCGLNMAEANTSLVPRGSAPLSCNLGELAWTPLSEPTPFLELDLGAGSDDGPWSGSCDLRPSSDGQCHFVALWVDFDLGLAASSGPAEGARPSTGPPSRSGAPSGWAQALQPLEAPLALLQGGPGVRLEAVLGKEGELKLEVLPAAAAGVVTAPSGAGAAKRRRALSG